ASRVDGAMRRPISRIIANAETIASQLDGPIRSDYNRYARDIALAGRHLMDLVDDLADLQAVERPGFAVAQEAVDLAEIGRRAAGLLSLKARDRTIAITPPDNDDRVIVTGEFRRVLQILLNLIGNAIAYSPVDSQVWVCVGTDGYDGWIVVADQGEGIAPEAQARIFNKFERLGRSDAAGSGLGLYISQRLANAMNGSISLDSAKGQGARFTLRLPLKHSL
ncbi:MAG: HAMP domain-containing histidine kinase, partial [Rhizobiales bacterium]|nr:HAMP domain-containing histidine kinase [Hyphomicrobiales bacterium]